MGRKTGKETVMAQLGCSRYLVGDQPWMPWAPLKGAPLEEQGGLLRELPPVVCPGI